MKLILASGSATRRRMLEAAGVPFETAVPEIDEEEAKAALVQAGLAPDRIAEGLAEAKARGVTVGAESLVVGADQVLETDSGALMSKPGSMEEARTQLRLLAGRTHWLHSAAVVVEQGACVWSHAESVAMTVRPLGEGFLSWYLDREYDEVRYNVGGYRIEGLGAQLFERIEGSHFAILGFPLLPFLAFLRERKVLPP